MSPIGKTVAVAAGSIAAAVTSALCCAGPLVAVFFGLSGAGLATTFEPLRPYATATTVLALGFGFAVVRREERKACEPGTLCASPRARHRMKWALWVATGISLPLITFPWWSGFVLG
ncbi:MAG: mercury transporter [Gemmatimonadetes bacterium]|nr:mercury transporter [Gemmatimonadota bacterium]